MADRDLVAQVNGGLDASNEVAAPGQGDAANPDLEIKIDGSNMATVTSLETTDHVIALVSNVPKKITVANLIASIGGPIIRSYIVKYDGTIEAAIAAGTKPLLQRKLIGVAGMKNTIVGIGIIGASSKFGSSGTTTIKVGDDEYDGTPTTQQVSIGYDETVKEMVAASIELPLPPAIPYFYVWPSAADRNHTGVEIQVDVKIERDDS